MKKSSRLKASFNEPILDKVKVMLSPQLNFTQYPFCLPLIKNLKEIEFPTQVTFFVGENGTGKSTLLEVVACKAGFGPEGGSKHINFKTSEDKTYSGVQLLAEHMTLSWRRKPTNGYFFRAESFFNVATYIDTLGVYTSYGNKSLHEQSHGESFMAFFKNRLGSEGFFVFDEPEAALSAQRQLSLLVIIHELCKNPLSQFIIATHSPLLLAFPGATIYSCDFDQLMRVTYAETSHYQITKRFLADPEGYLNNLLRKED